jgi:hypothetical protein
MTRCSHQCRRRARLTVAETMRPSSGDGGIALGAGPSFDRRLSGSGGAIPISLAVKTSCKQKCSGLIEKLDVAARPAQNRQPSQAATPPPGGLCTDRPNHNQVRFNRPSTLSTASGQLRRRTRCMTGGRPEELWKGRSEGTDATQNTRIHNSEHEPPIGCERCGAAFDRLHPHPRMSPKRFCSERCRKAAENQRAKHRKQDG